MSVNPDYVAVAIPYIVLVLASWSLRPSQPRSVSSRWFLGGKNDGLFRLLFNNSGQPRKYAWCAPLALSAMLVPFFIWWLSDA